MRITSRKVCLSTSCPSLVLELSGLGINADAGRMCCMSVSEFDYGRGCISWMAIVEMTLLSLSSGLEFGRSINLAMFSIRVVDHWPSRNAMPWQVHQQCYMSVL